MNLTKAQKALLLNMVNNELNNKETFYNPVELEAVKEQLSLCSVSCQREQSKKEKINWMIVVYQDEKKVVYFNTKVNKLLTYDGEGNFIKIEEVPKPKFF